MRGAACVPCLMLLCAVRTTLKSSRLQLPMSALAGQCIGATVQALLHNNCPVLQDEDVALGIATAESFKESAAMQAELADLEMVCAHGLCIS